MKKLYEQLIMIYVTEGKEAAARFYNEKIVPLVKKENKKMKAEAKEF